MVYWAQCVSRRVYEYEAAFNLDITPRITSHMALPSLVSIEFLHRRYARSEERFDKVYGHSRLVATVAQQLMQRRPLNVDPDVVTVGALLHDIGIYELQPNEPYLRHILLGYQLLRREGLPEVICRFAISHSGVGVTKEDIAAHHLALPPAHYVPMTQEEQLVMYADKFCPSNTADTHLASVDTIRRALRSFSPDKPPLFDHMVRLFGAPDEKLLARTAKNLAAR